ncbi:MAG TPA: GTPase RsgA [Persephonella sp.]|uniref:Ribosome biogenesis GTPase A n=1 Tax=Persephonella marina (strain DSM 14350 / EX-H1) TaxID=123214 RepID=C0QUF9_PERMH|nr:MULTISPECIES: GTPase [Persephonella]ACO02978.1 GTPase, MMR1/HSR1 family [Persephonella marina EX-H1]HCB70057.1 GTPase RsgA [Persephonella sp.]
MEKPREWLREKSIAKKILSKSDVIFEVIDARIPFETRNSVVEKLAKERNKRLFIIMNKVDLVPESFAKKVKKEIEKEVPVILFSAHKSTGKREIENLIRKLSKENRLIKIGVLGYPNVGKSSVINKLKGKKVATTSPKPGMTRGEQLVKLAPNVFLIDTPGIITLEFQEDLALKGSWIPEKLEQPVEIAQKLIKKIQEKRPEAIKESYGVEPSQDPYETLKRIGERLNYRVSGGEVDIDRTAKKVLWDWIKGNIKAYWI